MNHKEKLQFKLDKDNSEHNIRLHKYYKRIQNVLKARYKKVNKSDNLIVIINIHDDIKDPKAYIYNSPSFWEKCDTDNYCICGALNDLLETFIPDNLNDFMEWLEKSQKKANDISISLHQNRKYY